MRILKLFTIGMFLVVGMAGMQSTTANAALSDQIYKACGTAKDSAVCKSKNDDAPSLVKIVVNLLLYALGIISVIAIIIGGIRYATAGGTSAGINTARETIIYGVVGVVVGLMAWSIVNFVIGNF